MEIRIYEYINGEFVPRLNTYDAVNPRYKIHAYEPSEFSFDYSLDERGASEFQMKRFVLMENFIGVIKNIKRYKNTGGSMMTVSGVDIKGLLFGRTVIPHTFSGIIGTMGYDVAVGWTDACIKHFWRNNIGVNAETARRYNFITIGENKNIGKSGDKYQTRFTKLSDVTAEFAKGADLVITTTPQIESGKIILDVAEPVYRTAGQDIVSPVILSPENLTVLHMEHTQESTGYRNAFYATRSGSQFADEALTMLYMRDGETEPSGLDRVEEHINVSVNTPIAGDEYNEMRRQAVHDMQNYGEVNTLNATVNFTRLKLNRDYHVGDFVTVQNNDFGIEADIQITAVEVSENGNGRTETVTLGTDKKGYIRQILTEIKNI